MLKSLVIFQVHSTVIEAELGKVVDANIRGFGMKKVTSFVNNYMAC
jgi:hypothetical protein